MLLCKDLTKKYLGSTAVDALNLTIEQGHTYALLGPNGSGKTTFMKMVAGLVKPTSGEVTFEGAPIGTRSKAHIAYMPTEGYFFGYMTCGDVGKYYADFFADFSRDKFREMILEMELPEKGKVRTLSSGMMAKLKLAATLSRDSRLLMLDEPLNGIDIIAREKTVDAILSAQSPTRAILLSSHLVEDLEKVVDYAVFMKRGQVVLAGEAHALREARGQSIVEMYKEIYA
ncbi:MAG: ABC transporter ATP-binding protein [Clostridia bacterium]